MDTIPNLTYTVPNLRSGVSKRWQETFVLDEGSIRRFHQILENYANQLPEQLIVVFQVGRGDDRFYETLDVDDVLLDPNVSTKLISNLSIELRYPPGTVRHGFDEENWVVSIRFVKWETYFGVRRTTSFASFQIESDDRNWALSLADELEPQITKTFKSNEIPRWLLAIFLLPFSFFLIKVSNSVEELFKLAFLYLFGFAVVLGIVAGSIRVLAPPGWGNRLFGPESVFLWGKEGQEYLIREANRRKILWGGIAASIVSCVISVLWLLL